MLIIRFSAMGDVAMSLHAVKALRETYPDLRITIVTKPRFARFYETIDGAEVMTLEAPGNLKSLCRLIRRLMSSDMDCVADIHNTIRGKIIRNILRLKGARVEKLDKQRHLRRRLRRMKGRDIIPLRHNVLRFCDVFARLGFPVPVPEVRKVRLAMPDAFANEKALRPGRWAGFAPFASKDMKIYPRELSGRLTGLMSGKFDTVFIFTGPGAEKEFAMEMEKKYSNVISVFGRTDIWGEMAIMSNLEVLVTMDSSAMHMASVVGTRTVSVWGATHPAAGFYGYGETPDDFVQMNLPCRPCSIYGEGKCTAGEKKCLTGISPELIMSRL